MAKRALYSMYSQYATFSRIGRLFPICIEEVAPGDTWSGKLGLLVRLSPLKRALLTDLYVDTFYIYVPHRLVSTDWEDFITDGPMDTPNVTLPSATIANNSYESLYYSAPSAGTYDVSALRIYALNLIWNEFFRDYQQATRLPTDAPGRLGIACNYKRDYWTLLQNAVTQAQTAGFAADVTSGTPDTVSAQEILRAIAQEKAAMRRATYGTRYIDILRSMGIRVNYQMLQRPEVVAVGRGSINVTDVVQTAEGATDPLGTLAGHGIAGQRLSIRRKTFPEHGTLFGLCLVRPVHVNPDYLDWFDTVRDFTSYYDPGLVSMPPVNVTTGDVSSEATTPTDSLGYWPWGDWYRRSMSRSHNGFGVEWTNAVGGNANPTFSNLKLIGPSDFDSVFNDTTYGHFQVSAVNKLKALRKIQRPAPSIVGNV